MGGRRARRLHDGAHPACHGRYPRWQAPRARREHQGHSNLLSEVPTIAEADVAGFDYPIWYGIWAPAGTPAEVVEKVAKDIARALGAPDVRASLAKDGADPVSMTQPEFVRFVLSEAENAKRIVEAAGIKPQ